MFKHFLILVLLLNGVVYADEKDVWVMDSKSASRIQGVTDFLVVRANESYLYIFENKIRNNQKFACYFPETYSYISDGDLKALIKTPEIWKETMDKDFATLKARILAHGMHAILDRNQKLIAESTTPEELLKYLEIKPDDGVSPGDMSGEHAGRTPDQIMAGLARDLGLARKQMVDFDEQLKVFKDLCAINQPDAERIKNEIEKLKGSYQSLERWLRDLQAYKHTIRLNTTLMRTDCEARPTMNVCAWRNRVFEDMVPEIRQSLEKSVSGALAYLVALDRYSRNIDDRKSYTARVVEAFKVIREEKLEDSEQVMKFKHYALFFAQVADSTSPAQVQGLLKEYTLPVTSFLAKREPGESVMMITSYLGYSAGSVLNDDRIESDNISGFYVPIGLEYSRGRRNGTSLSIMLSPVDFGYPVSLKLNGIEEEIELDEIVAPSISLAWGIKNYPVNMGIAFQKGKRFETQNQEEKRLLFFLAFDMPLFAF